MSRRILNRAWANVSLVQTATEDLLEWSHLKWLIFLEWMFSPNSIKSSHIGPGNAQTWIDSAYPDCVPEEVV